MRGRGFTLIELLLVLLLVALLASLVAPVVTGGIQHVAKMAVQLIVILFPSFQILRGLCVRMARVARIDQAP